MSGIGILLKKIVRKSNHKEKIRLKDILMSEKKNNIYFIILLNALLSMIPLPIPFPFISMMFGIILIILSFQLLINKEEKVYIPRKILNISFKKKLVNNVILKISPRIRKLEIYIKRKNKKKQEEQNNKKYLFILNFCILISSIIMIIPISTISTIPSIAIVIICFGIINKNKLFTNLGILFTILSVFSVFLYYLIGKFIFMSIKSNV